MHDPQPLLAHIPHGQVAVPQRVVDLTDGRELEPVWVNGLGGLTFRDAGPQGAGAGSPVAAGSAAGARFVKWVAAGTPELDLAAEAERLRWARSHGALVPEVLDSGADDSGSWLLTAALAGESAVAPPWIAEPAAAARAIGAGLRALHDTLPVDSCPYDWGIDGRIAKFEERVRAGASPAEWSAEHRGLSIDRARQLLRDRPEVDLAVVCHGDACAPNTLLAPDGSFAAHVDLDSLGVADRWADLAVAAWSTEWNYGPRYDHLVYKGYEIDPDPIRIAYYRLLWDLS